MNHNKQTKKILLLVAVLAVLALILYSATRLMESVLTPDTGEVAIQSKTVSKNGTDYFPRQDITTILLMGVDRYGPVADSEAYNNSGASDLNILVIIDETAESVDLLYLNRDTMVEMPVLGIGGRNAGTYYGQLALAHTYGSGLEESCENTVETISKLLGGIRIDYYLSMNMDTIAILNDAVGGVTVEVKDDFSQVDPTLVKGEQVLLKGDQALTYVRTRKDMEDSSNLRRMERQRQFMDALYEKLLDCTENNPDFLLDALLQLSDSVMSDCTPTQLEALFDLMEECALNSITPLKGEAVKGDEFMEFYTDEDSLKQTVISLFCD